MLPLTSALSPSTLPRPAAPLPTGVYGDVQRVKILYNKKDSALVQMSEPHQAHLGMSGFSLDVVMILCILG